VKFFITSRPEVHVALKEAFVYSWGHSNFILHEVEKEIVKADKISMIGLLRLNLKCLLTCVAPCSFMQQLFANMLLRGS
jgi:hypothetical protein